MKVNLCKGLDQKIAKKAIHMIEDYHSGKIQGRDPWVTRQDMIVLNINYRYRAYSLKPEIWHVVTHETYNKILRQS